MNPEWLTAIGTLVLAAATAGLAGVTVWSVKKNNEANRSLREETERLHKQEQARLGKLQALDVISNWADEATNIIGDKMFSLHQYPKGRGSGLPAAQGSRLPKSRRDGEQVGRRGDGLPNKLSVVVGR